MDPRRNGTGRPWYVTLAFGLAVVAGVIVLSESLSPAGREVAAAVVAAVWLVLLIMAISGIGIRHRSRIPPYVLLSFSMLLATVLSHGPFSAQPWAEPVSLAATLVGAAAAVWLMAIVFRPRRDPPV